ncbi:MAG: hypothetical protein WA254_04610 [Candidatus Sulfotelmatobacter sp.]
MQLPAKNERSFFIVLTGMFLIGWTSFLVSTLRHWHEISSPYTAVCFAVVYPLPWVMLLMENRNKLQMALVAYVVLFLAVKLLLL